MRVFNNQGGFTIIEILITIGLIGVVITGILILINPAKQLAKGRDAQRKGDIKLIQSALELHRADHGVYASFNGGGGGHWFAEGMEINNKPGITYLRTIPVGPYNSDRCVGDYLYATPNFTLKDYTIFTVLENVTDPDVTKLKVPPKICPGCSPSSPVASVTIGAGTCNGKTFNYWVNSP